MAVYEANQTYQPSAHLAVARPTISTRDIERPQSIKEGEDHFDYSQRAQWLRAAVLGANDGLVSTASLMMGVGAVKEDVKFMILTGFAGLIAGACSMAIGEFVSVYSQLDIEVAQIKRDNLARKNEENDSDNEKENLPNPFQAAGASAVAFSIGAMVPILAAAFIKDHKARMGVVAGATSLALKSPLLKSSLRVLFGGWIAMAITFGLTKLVGKSGL
ncbi:hypothetical protein MKW92_006817 [Papaver armeniacum]|nr:hypothetical protein MKW92_006817 [Papaver armeniacum]